MPDYDAYTDKGSRKVNEDCLGAEQNADAQFFFLADGLGGHGKGDMASHLVIEKAGEFVRNQSWTKTYFKDLFQYCQNALIAEQQRLGYSSQMKTTLTAVAIGKHQVQWAHIGDSRVYFFKRKRLAERTLDHSVPQMLAASGMIKESEIRHHEDRNRLLKVIGEEWSANPCETSKLYRKTSGMAFLLCSDGFWELIDEKQMCDCLKKAKTAKQWIEMMKKIVMKYGAGTDMDNNTALGIFL